MNWLRTQSGDSWQQRWRASGAEDHPDWRRSVGVGRAKPMPHLSPGLLVLICADAIRPGVDWLLRFAPARHNLATEMARTRDPGAFAALATLCRQGRVGLQGEQRALTQVAVVMAIKGGLVEQVRVGDCVELLAVAERVRTTSDRHANSPLFYQLLRAHGGLGPDAPAIEVFSGRGQASCEQLIDRYRIACRPVRDVLTINPEFSTLLDGGWKEKCTDGFGFYYSYCLLDEFRSVTGDRTIDGIRTYLGSRRRGRRRDRLRSAEKE